jgi:hypothetical protein
MKKTIFCFLIIVAAEFSNFVFGAIPAKERAALIALYNATGGDNWKKKSGWKTAPLHTDGFALPGTEGDWYGIGVEKGHVIVLYAVSNNLKGSIPPKLGNLSNLMVWCLDNNHLSGSIPAELGNLSNLEHLTLHTNQLSGSIPPELGNLSHLVCLNLNKNQLSGSIPPGLGNLTQLINLCLGNNKLSGEIPPGLKNLTNIINLDIGYNCLFAIDTALRNWLNIHDPDWELHQDQCTPLGIRLNRAQLYFSVTTAGTGTTEQKVQVDSSGGGMLTWTANADSSWLSLTPTSGRGPGLITVSINATGLEIGDYTGTITVSDPNATNSPQAVSVFLKVYQDSETQNPFGEFSTPLDGTTVSGSIPVTGWALDDIEVMKVEIFSGETYVGDAVFVEGARPDVEQAYPDYPKNYRAGWGYMLLTNFLPGGGNGTYTLEARAIDAEGHQVTLGTKIITVDNANAVKPFGAIDTPGQGGTAAGSDFINWGWALTPSPNTIPIDGSTIQVWVDGVSLGHPVYNQYRKDVSALFPGYNNSSGAGGWFRLDTTAYENGVHTISWSVMDNAGNIDGIGSRYFTIQNLAGSMAQVQEEGNNYKKFLEVQEPFYQKGSWPPEALFLQRGYNPTRELETLSPDENGRFTIEIKELERLIIYLEVLDTPGDPGHYQGCLVNGDELKPLPIGSTLDAVRGIFYWQPGPGFLGTFRLVFIETDSQGNLAKKNIWVTIIPQYGGR